jgi:uncharacterized membrane protein
MTLYHLNKNSNNYLAVALVLTAVIAATGLLLLLLFHWRWLYSIGTTAILRHQETFRRCKKNNTQYWK